MMNVFNAATMNDSTSHRHYDTMKNRQLTTDTQSTAGETMDCSIRSYFNDSSVDDTHDGSTNQALHNSIHSYYEVLPHTIGEGKFGFVRECVSRADPNTKYAVKMIPKKANATENDHTLIELEMKLLEYAVRAGNNQGVVNLIDFFKDSEYYYIITDLCNGGELYDHIIDQMSSPTRDYEKTLFKEQDAIEIIKSFVTTVSKLHDLNIVHRDIKPENLLYDSEGNLKLIDFGLATILNDGSRDNETSLQDFVGTPFYMAPEILKRSGYGKAVDVRSIGVLAYILLVGQPPFVGDSDEDIYKAIRRGHYDVPNSIQLSQEGRDFLGQLLKRDPQRRVTAKQAAQHSWIVNNSSSK